jgi:hypothetical protein
MKWYYNFIKRWPELHAVKPSSLSELRAKSTSPACIKKYFDELGKILKKYDLCDKPHLIYNVDEKDINTGGGKPPHIVTSRNKIAQVVTPERSQTVTVLGCGNAAGSNILPYLVFPGKRMLPELMNGAIPGCDGTVSDTGYSNTHIFTSYVKEHFLKYVQSRDSSQPVLLLYDGHRSHISLSLIKWAQENNIILFVLPPHTSHILQPMDVGCFGPFETLYQQEVHKFMRQSVGRSVTRYDICSLVCKVYEKSLSSDNLRSSFKRTGIHPLNPLVIDTSRTIPSLVYTGKSILNDNTCNVAAASQITNNTNNDSISVGDFFAKRGGDVLKATEIAKKPRRNISSVIAGKAITEIDVSQKIEEYQLETARKKNKPNGSKTKNCKSKSIKKQSNNEQQPGPSKENTKVVNFDNGCDISDEDVSIRDEEKCCVCGDFEPKALRDKPYIEFVKWAQCVVCCHWVHLSYCVPEKVVRKDTEVVCPHCKQQ